MPGREFPPSPLRLSRFDHRLRHRGMPASDGRTACAARRRTELTSLTGVIISLQVPQLGRSTDGPSSGRAWFPFSRSAVRKFADGAYGHLLRTPSAARWEPGLRPGSSARGLCATGWRLGALPPPRGSMGVRKRASGEEPHAAPRRIRPPRGEPPRPLAPPRFHAARGVRRRGPHRAWCVRWGMGRGFVANGHTPPRPTVSERRCI